MIMKKYQGIILTFLGVILIFGLIWLLQTINKNQGTGSPAAASSNSLLSAEETSFDFGNVSMAKGIVSHAFKIKNTGSEPLTITKLYTSCMCTEATFVKSDIEKGPFGMPGMGYIPQISQTLAVGEEAEILVTFDPAAHGPAGLGQINRTVYLENSGKSNKLELSFSANVAP